MQWKNDIVFVVPLNITSTKRERDEEVNAITRQNLPFSRALVKKPHSFYCVNFSDLHQVIYPNFNSSSTFNK